MHDYECDGQTCEDKVKGARGLTPAEDIEQLGRRGIEAR
jgi:hypothetical protein